MAQKIISRKEARINGFKRYFTGEPCKRGHITDRITSNKGCVECRRTIDAASYRRAYYQGSLKKTLAKYRKKNKKEIKAYEKRRYQSDPIQRHSWVIKQRYGITAEQYRDLFLKQGGRCALCGKVEQSVHPRYKRVKRLAIDHHHATGKVRGLLCSCCNTGIGMFGDDPDLMIKAAHYVRSHK